MTIEPAEKAKLHEALERANGNRSLAAAYIGITSEQMRRRILDCADLRTVWATGGSSPAPLMDSDTISRPVQKGILISPEEDAEIAAMLLKEEVLLSKGLQTLILTQDEQKLAVALGSFNQRHFFRAMDIIGGGVTRAHMKLQTELDALSERLKEVRVLIRAGQYEEGAEGGGRASLVDEEKGLCHNFISITKVMKEMFEAQNKSNILMAGIRLKLMGKGGLDDTMKKAKPGFSDTQPSVENGG